MCIIVIKLYSELRLWNVQEGGEKVGRWEERGEEGWVVLSPLPPDCASTISYLICYYAN